MRNENDQNQGVAPSDDVATRHANHLEPTSPEEGQALDDILALLLQTFRVDFAHYRRTTVLRRLARRMGLCKTDGYLPYRDLVKADPRELSRLYDDLLLSFTEFFREPAAFVALEERVFPRLLQHGSAKTPIRIWAPGCSTGEEVYSLAISIYEFMEASSSKPPVQLFGTDLVERHVAKARLGEYPTKIETRVSKARLRRFFHRTPDGYKVTKPIREMCVFAVQDVAQDPPFPRIDLVSCRNLLIYLDTSFQEIAIPLFHFALSPHGFLLLGSSETTARFPELFVPVDTKVNLYAKRNAGIKPIYKFPMFSPPKSTGNAETSASRASGKNGPHDLSRQVDRLLIDTYAPPGVLVDRHLHIRQFIGPTSRYLEPVPGEASLKLSRMAADGLMPDISVAVEEVRKTRTPVHRKGITYKRDSRSHQTDLAVFPIADDTNAELCFLVLFQEATAPPTTECATNGQATAAAHGPQEEVARLWEELQSTKAHLQTIIEEKEEVNQELWGANEEVQSTNEELQSVNEEMEAAKEELESSNEELLALNEELQVKNAALTEAGQMMDSFFKQTLVMLMIADLQQNKLVRVNEELARITERSERELLEMAFADLFHPDDRAPTLCAMTALRSGKPLVGYRNRHVTATGRVRRFEWTAVPSTQQSLVHAMARDVTEEERVEKTLREKDFIIRSASTAIVTADVQGCITYANAAFRAMWGFTDAHQLDARPFTDLCGSDSKMGEIMTALSGGEKLWRGELQARRRDGTHFSVLASAATVLDNDNAPLGIVFTASDITERKEAERTLAESEAQFRGYIESAPDAIMVMNERGRCISVNEAACQITGYCEDEFKTIWLLDLVHDDYKPRVQQHFQTLQSSRRASGELKYIRKDGTSGHCVVDAARLSPTRYICFAKDVTEHQHLADRLRQAEKMQVVGQLAGGIAHDFNNQLAGILGYADIIRNEADEGSSVSRYTENICLAVKRAKDLTSQLLAFSRKGKYVNAPVDVHHLIFEVVNLLRHSIDKRIVIRQELNAHPSSTEGDPSQLQNAILNLGLNARDAMHDGGTLLLRTDTVMLDAASNVVQSYDVAPGPYLRLRVSDSGVGMDDETLQRIFEPFFTTKEQGQGTGMGLAAVYGTVKSHRGSISVRSERGGGSLFEIHLPLFQGARRETVQETRPQSAAIQHSSAHIMLVDDEDLVRCVTQELLESLGYTVTACADGTAAIELYRKEYQSVDLVLLDMVMPAMNGEDTFAALKRINPKVKVLITSGYSAEGCAKKLLRGGASGHIQKPYRRRDLAKEVARILGLDP